MSTGVSKKLLPRARLVVSSTRTGVSEVLRRPDGGNPWIARRARVERLPRLGAESAVEADGVQRGRNVAAITPSSRRGLP
jgi:hypothetical protein